MKDKSVPIIQHTTSQFEPDNPFSWQRTVNPPHTIINPQGDFLREMRNQFDAFLTAEQQLTGTKIFRKKD